MAVLRSGSGATELWGVRAPMWLGALILAVNWVPILFSPLRREP
ncbi:hypothetical protein [Microtetraspora malaysiensis]|uniref:Uncharacterized protein n=1 Tax=Microtetraspora malaysiensis TaxID=161358 RepID=A0ABW6SMF7_9ACTN